MAELIPAPFEDLVRRLFIEPRTQDAVFELPRRSWYLPGGTPDLSVQFHDHRAGNPGGPAAGPHTQMAQNLLLSYVAGGRILELKTVQVKDRLEIPRPCIDMTNIGYNVEWSQELRIEDSIREYIAGAMLIEMFRHSEELAGGALDGTAGDVIYDISVGYDLAGIQSDSVRGFLGAMRDASTWVERLRSEIPREFRGARNAEYPTHLSDSVTLSTFHGCPVEEIAAICEFLIAEYGFHVIVKMNPPTLGRDRVEHLLYDVMGYRELRVNPNAYGAAATMEQSVQVCDHLTRFAAERGRRLGFKFSNTLEVLNHRDFFTPDNEIMYLSGQPLHVITMTLTDEFRQRVGPHVPISFSAGIDRHNFALAVACGFVPVTISTDLLRPGGFGRLPAYLQRLSNDMEKRRAASIDDYILARFDRGGEARRRANKERGEQVEPDELHAATVAWAGWLNTPIAARLAREDERYRADKTGKVPRRIDSHLVIFDCITCDKCLPVCPNAANFEYPTPLADFEYSDIVVAPDGSWRDGPSHRFEITKELQIACYADFCNECGNCDTFCPEYGGPYIEKPSFFSSRDSWERAAPRDGFYIERKNGARTIRGRIKGAVYGLTIDPERTVTEFDDDKVLASISAVDHRILKIQWLVESAHEHAFDMGIYHTLRHLLDGVLDKKRINQVNVPLYAAP